MMTERCTLRGGFGECEYEFAGGVQLRLKCILVEYSSDVCVILRNELPSRRDKHAKQDK